MRCVILTVLLVCYAYCDTDGWDGPSWEDDLVWATPALGLNESEPVNASLGDQLDSFFKETFGNNLTDQGPWTVVSFITLMPLRCSEVQRIVSWFDVALQKANPAVQVSSIATRLGVATCDVSGCPCDAARRYATRVLEIRSQSTAKSLLLPDRDTFPYYVEAGGVI